MRNWDLVIREGLAAPTVAPEHTGRGVRIAVVDTGVNFQHPHLALPSAGVGVDREDGQLVVRPGSHRDLLGHGTCCAALIHLLAPDAALFAVRVTGERGTTDADRLARGIEVAAESGAHLIAVALGTRTRLWAGLADSVAAAISAGAHVIAADPEGEVWPARCPGALAVAHQDGVDLAPGPAGYVAEGRARPAEGYASNFWGSSLSAARAAAALARVSEASGVTGAALLTAVEALAGFQRRA